MAVQDFGSGLLSGIQGAMAFNQQRRDNAARDRELAQADRRLDLAEQDYEFRLRSYDEGAEQRAATLEGTRLTNTAQDQLNKDNAFKARTTTNNEIIKGYQALDILDRQDPTKFNRDAIRAGVESGSAPHIQLLLATATQSGILPEGSVAESIQALPDGGYAVTVRNADGSQGVVTEDGSSRPDSTVVEFSPGQLAGLAETTYKMNVLSNQSIYDVGMLRAQQTRIDADAEAADIDSQIGDKLAEIEYQRQVVAAIPDAGAQRAAVSAISAAETPEEQAQITDAIAQDVGVEPRERPKGYPVGQAERRQRQNRVASGGASDAQPEQALTGFSTPETAKQADDISQQTEGMTTQEVNEAVSSGDVVVSSELINETARVMKDAGIQDLADLKKLNNKDRALARAVILASTGDAAMRNRMSDEINNIFETGVASMSLKDAEGVRQTDETLRIRNSELRQKIREFNRNVGKDEQTRIDAAASNSAAFQKDSLALFFGENGDENNLNAATARRFSRTVLAPYLSVASASATPAEEGYYQRGLNTALSLAVAGLAAEEEGGVFETLASFFRADAIDRTTGSDFDLSRVRMETRGGKPTKFYYTGPNGETLDEGIDAVDLQRLDDTIYKIVVDAATKNAGG